MVCQSAYICTHTYIRRPCKKETYISIHTYATSADSKKRFFFLKVQDTSVDDSAEAANTDAAGGARSKSSPAAAQSKLQQNTGPKARYSLYLLYRYKSTSAAQQAAAKHGSQSQVLALLALQVQKYNCCTASCSKTWVPKPGTCLLCRYKSTTTDAGAAPVPRPSSLKILSRNASGPLLSEQP
jgi:hypothetical protein